MTAGCLQVEPTMPRSKRDDEVVKIAREVVRKARIVAAYRNVPIAEYMSERLAPLVEEDLAEHQRLAAVEAVKPKKAKQ